MPLTESEVLELMQSDPRYRDVDVDQQLRDLNNRIDKLITDLRVFSDSLYSIKHTSPDFKDKQ